MEKHLPKPPFVGSKCQFSNRTVRGLWWILGREKSPNLQRCFAKRTRMAVWVLCYPQRGNSKKKNTNNTNKNDVFKTPFRCASSSNSAYPPGNSHIPAGKRENHLQKGRGRGYVSSQQGMHHSEKSIETRIQRVFPKEFCSQISIRVGKGDPGQLKGDPGQLNTPSSHGSCFFHGKTKVIKYSMTYIYIYIYICM